MKSKNSNICKIGEVRGNFLLLDVTNKRNNSGNLYYKVKCLNCKNIYETTYFSFLKRKSVSCDLCRFAIVREDKVINNWHVQKAAYVDSGNYYHFCVCLVCNKTRIVQVTNIFNGTSKSCCGKTHTSDAHIKIFYNRYKCNANYRNLVFTLSIEEFRDVVTKNCTYCGSGGSVEVYHKATKRYDYYNGVDRKNSNIGYTKENTTSCCKRCNRGKFDDSVKDYEAYLDKLIKFRTNNA